MSIEAYRVETMVRGQTGLGPDSPVTVPPFMCDVVARMAVETWEKDNLATTLINWVGIDDYRLARSWFAAKREIRYNSNPDLSVLHEVEYRRMIAPTLTFCESMESVCDDARTFWVGRGELLCQTAGRGELI